MDQNNESESPSPYLLKKVQLVSILSKLISINQRNNSLDIRTSENIFSQGSIDIIEEFFFISAI